MKKDKHFATFMTCMMKQTSALSNTEEDAASASTASKASTEVQETIAKEDDPKFGLDGVAGMKELKKLVRRDFIDILNNKELARVYGIQPSSIMFYGAPGNGKTFFVKKVAEELKMNFMTVVPDDIASVYVHGTQEKIAEIFQDAIDNAPTLLFLDEFDSMVPHRNGRNVQSGEVAEFLTQMNDLADKEVYVIAATNHPEAIDRAVLRSGRIDNIIYVPLPDKEARLELFRLELSNRPSAPDVSFDKLVELTDNYTASDISSIVKEAGRIAFDMAHQNPDKPIAPISQSILEEVIAAKPSSVTADDMRFYENLQRQFSKKSSANRPRIGFNQ